MSKNHCSKSIFFLLLLAGFGWLPALPVAAQMPLGDITVDDFEAIDDFPPLMTSQSFTLPVEPSTQKSLNLAEQIPNRQIFIPPVQSSPIASPVSPIAKPPQTEMPSRPSLSDVMLVQPAPLPYFVYQSPTE